MKKRHLFSLFIISIVLTSGCANKIPLTRALLSEYSISQTELRRLQYYPSGRIDLKREDRNLAKIREGDKLSASSEIIKDHIYVQSNTKGIADEADFNNLKISFEEGSAFTFAWRADSSLKNTGKYRLQPKRELTVEEKKAQLVPLGNYVFDYRDKEYFSQQTDNIFLKVKLKDLRKTIQKRHRLKGRTVDPNL